MHEFSSKRSWRYIDSDYSSGPRNMAIDEALLSSFDPVSSLPIIRTYGWRPAALSLGRFQNAAASLDLDRCRSDALPIVRRVSGGGAIFHDSELTYSIVCSSEHLPAAVSVKESFRILTGFLHRFYSGLGLNSCYAIEFSGDVEKLGLRTDFCYAGHENFDILVNGKKIGGNAQRRLRNIIFQHGSIPLTNRALYGLQYMKDCNSVYAENTVSLEDCGITFDISMLKRMFVEAFTTYMDTDVVGSLLLNCEHLLAGQLESKYESDCWNLRGELE